VVVAGSLGADALVRRLNKAGKMAALWPTAEAKKKPEEEVAADKADAKPKDKQGGAEGSSPKKPEKDNKGSEKKKKKKKKKPERVVDAANKQKDDGKATEEKGSGPEPAKEASAGEGALAGEQEGSVKKKKKNKQHKDGGGVAEGEKPPPQQEQPMPAPAPRQHLHVGGGFPPYHAPQPVTSYNVAHPSASVSYHCYAPAPAVPMQPMPPPYGGYPPMMPPPEYLYGPPGMRTPPPQESYSNVFDEENSNSCSLM
jgi:hypothetical protein